MSKFLYGSVCLSDIPKELITTSQSNGKQYLNIAVSERKEKGQYGETHTISVSQPKEQRNGNEKPIYIGNLRTWEDSQENKRQSGGSPVNF